MPENKYAAQKKALGKMKQLRVWFDPEEYDTFKATVEANGESIYSVIHHAVEQYIAEHKAEE